MKHKLVTIVAAVVLLAPVGEAFARANIQLNLGLGLPVYVAPPPVYYEPPQQYYTPPPPIYYGPSVIYDDRHGDREYGRHSDRDHDGHRRHRGHGYR